LRSWRAPLPRRRCCSAWRQQTWRRSSRRTCTTRCCPTARDNTQCPANGFYNYDAFIQAANFFPGFGTSSSTDELNKRELAAFFGQTSHETTGR
jgi:hypothetical protein